MESCSLGAGPSRGPFSKSLVIMPGSVVLLYDGGSTLSGFAVLMTCLRDAGEGATPGIG